MVEFKVGDRVIAIKPFASNECWLGVTGTIVELSAPHCSVEFDFDCKCVKRGDLSSTHGHTCGGKAESGRGWNGYCNELELINKGVESPEEKVMAKKIGFVFSKLADEATQTLAKAGFINGDLELTSKGKEALIDTLFIANKSAMVQLAQDQIDAEAKSPKDAE